MFIEAWKLTGMNIDEKRFTQLTFNQFIKENPNITLDEAILRFENAPVNQSLEVFAKSKMRTAESYQRIYRPFLKNLR